MEHRDRLERFGAGYPEVALFARGRTVIVADQGQSTDDLVGDMVEVLTSMCACLSGLGGARNQAMRAVTATKQAKAFADG